MRRIYSPFINEIHTKSLGIFPTKADRSGQPGKKVVVLSRKLILSEFHETFFTLSSAQELPPSRRQKKPPVGCRRPGLGSHAGPWGPAASFFLLLTARSRTSRQNGSNADR